MKALTFFLLASFLGMSAALELPAQTPSPVDLARYGPYPTNYKEIVLTWLYSQKQAMDLEGRAFGRETIQRLAVNHDVNFFANNLGPQGRLDYPPSQQQYIVSKFTELGVPAQPIKIDENMTWESHFFEPKG